MFTDAPAAFTDTPAPPAAAACATGPRTPDGKRIAARNATTHGLFARDVVLPHLGEDPHAYDAVLEELTAQLRPRSLLQRHYVEKIAAASWRLRRLHRWQAQLFEDTEMPVREILAQLDSVLRHETTLHRQIDTSIKMLGRELPHLLAPGARQEALDHLGATEDYCAHNPGTAFRVERRERELLDLPVTPPGLDLSRLDTAPASEQAEEQAPGNCQNEPAPDPHSSPFPKGEVARNEPEGVPSEGVLAPPSSGAGGRAGGRFCQNEPAIKHKTLSSPTLSPARNERQRERVGGLPPG